MKSFVNPKSLTFLFKVRWFKDILKKDSARRYLWSLYYAGEAYEALHPQDVYIPKLPPKWGRLLQKQLQDENRHAEVFEALLAQDGLRPTKLSPEEDLGYFLLTHVVPDVVAAARQNRPFSTEETARYMGFLHALETRSITDLCALRRAAEELGERQLAQKISDILKDERFHASYTLAGMRAFSQSSHRALYKRIRNAERRYYNQSINCMINRFEQLGAKPVTWFGKLRWSLMKLTARLGLAAAPLPIYETAPRALMPKG